MRDGIPQHNLPSFWAIWPVLLAFVFLSTLFNALVPLGEGPDEPGHIGYVLFLVNEKRLPVALPAGAGGDERPEDVPGEGHQPPLAYLLATPAVFWLPPDQRIITQTSNPDFLWNGGSDGDAFIRASHEYWPWKAMTLAWHLARGSSCLAGVVMLLGVWGAARALFPYSSQWFAPHSQRVIPFLATTIVALNPQVLFTSALVTNDSWLAAWSAVLFWLCCVPIRGEHPRLVLKHAAGMGSILGLALLTKQSAILLIPLVLVASWRAGEKKRLVLLHLATWGSVALAMSGWWYLRNWHHYGDLMGLQVFRATFSSGPFAWDNPAAWFGAIHQLHASFWARFGWLTISPPPWVLWGFGILEGVALLGWFKIGLRSRALCLSRPPHASSPFLFVWLLPLLAFAWVISFAWAAGLVAWQGRFLFPALAAIGLILATGMAAWFPVSPSRAMMRLVSGRRGGGAVLTAALTMSLLALFLLIGVIKSAYRWETLPPDQAQQQLGNPITARFAHEWEKGILLQGWHVAGMHTRSHPPDIASGSTITVTLTWHALQRLPDDWVVFVHLLGPKESDVIAHEVIIAEHNGRPRLERFPLSLWTPGDWIADPHPLTLPPDLPPGPYRLRVGLWQFPFRGKRMPVWAADNSPAGNVVEIPIVLLVLENQLRAIPTEHHP